MARAKSKKKYKVVYMCSLGKTFPAKMANNMRRGAEMIPMAEPIQLNSLVINLSLKMVGITIQKRIKAPPATTLAMTKRALEMGFGTPFRVTVVPKSLK